MISPCDCLDLLCRPHFLQTSIAELQTFCRPHFAELQPFCRPHFAEFLLTLCIESWMFLEFLIVCWKVTICSIYSLVVALLTVTCYCWLIRCAVWTDLVVLGWLNFMASMVAGPTSIASLITSWIWPVDWPFECQISMVTVSTFICIPFRKSISSRVASIKMFLAVYVAWHSFRCGCCKGWGIWVQITRKELDFMLIRIWICFVFNRFLQYDVVVDAQCWRCCGCEFGSDCCGFFLISSVRISVLLDFFTARNVLLMMTLFTCCTHVLSMTVRSFQLLTACLWQCPDRGGADTGVQIKFHISSIKLK